MRAAPIRWLFVLLLALATQAIAQAYPDKPITLIVPFAASGPTDTVGRLLADAMSTELKQTVAVENISGAGGTVGATRVAKAANDGYTLLLNHMGQAAAPALYPKLAYDPLVDFQPIGRVADVPMTLVARGNMPARDLKELIAWIKTNGNKVIFAHAGRGSVSHLCGLLLMKALGVQMTPVAYRGTGPAMTDLLSHQIDLMCDQTTNTAVLIRSGQIKVYAVTTKARLPSMKDVPTFAESGLPGVEITAWHALFAPKGTPKPVVDRLRQALQAALKDPAFTTRLDELGAVPVKQSEATPAALQAWMKAEVTRWTPIIKAAGGAAE
ncbi:MAG TPA: tripartite tricarboxylate transporter substrate-binding protein [Burkholderiaceae bacterium]|nr:tripartite tricarboxylate transporter substrate-binding protein [Burkholderiaceae bacterium]